MLSYCYWILIFFFYFIILLASKSYFVPVKNLLRNYTSLGQIDKSKSCANLPVRGRNSMI